MLWRVPASQKCKHLPLAAMFEQADLEIYLRANHLDSCLGTCRNNIRFLTRYWNLRKLRNCPDDEMMFSWSASSSWFYINTDFWILWKLLLKYPGKIQSQNCQRKPWISKKLYHIVNSGDLKFWIFPPLLSWLHLVTHFVFLTIIASPQTGQTWKLIQYCESLDQMLNTLEFKVGVLREHLP